MYILLFAHKLYRFASTPKLLGLCTFFHEAAVVLHNFFVVDLCRAFFKCWLPRRQPLPHFYQSTSHWPPLPTTPQLHRRRRRWNEQTSRNWNYIETRSSTVSCACEDGRTDRQIVRPFPLVRLSQVPVEVKERTEPPLIFT